MNFIILEALYRVGQESVTIVTRNPFGGLTNIDTTQAALDAERADPSHPWGDDELLAVVSNTLPGMFPSATGIAVALYVAPEPIAP